MTPRTRWTSAIKLSLSAEALRLCFIAAVTPYHGFNQSSNIGTDVNARRYFTGASDAW
jgi:hypothetical protein